MTVVPSPSEVLTRSTTKPLAGSVQDKVFYRQAQGQREKELTRVSWLLFVVYTTDFDILCCFYEFSNINNYMK